MMRKFRWMNPAVSTSSSSQSASAQPLLNCSGKPNIYTCMFTFQRGRSCARWKKEQKIQSMEFLPPYWTRRGTVQQVSSQGHTKEIQFNSRQDGFVDVIRGCNRKFWWNIRCTICRGDLKYYGSTTAMWHHLRAKHHQAYERGYPTVAQTLVSYSLAFNTHVILFYYYRYYFLCGFLFPEHPSTSAHRRFERSLMQGQQRLLQTLSAGLSWAWREREHFCCRMGVTEMVTWICLLLEGSETMVMHPQRKSTPSTANIEVRKEHISFWKPLDLPQVKTLLGSRVKSARKNKSVNVHWMSDSFLVGSSGMGRSKSSVVWKFFKVVYFGPDKRTRYWTLRR